MITGKINNPKNIRLPWFLQWKNLMKAEGKSSGLVVLICSFIRERKIRND
jgi:hypothetical protein